MSKPEFKENIVQFQYHGATVQISRYPGPAAWGWQWQHFISIDGDGYPYGVPYRHYGIAVRVAKRRIDKGDYDPSPLFKNTGSFSVDYPKCKVCGEMFLPANKEQNCCSEHAKGGAQ